MKFVSIIKRGVVCLAVAAATAVMPGQAMAVQGEYGEYPEPTGTMCYTGIAPGACYTFGDDDALVNEQVTRFFDVNNLWGFWYPTSNTYSGSFPPDCWYLHKSMDLWKSQGSPTGNRHCVFVGSEMVHRYYKRFMFADIPQEDWDALPPVESATHIERRVGGTVVVVNFTAVSKRDTETVETYCRYYRSEKVLTANNSVAKQRTPDSVMQACAFERREDDQVTDETTTSTQDAISVPTRAARCGSVRPPGGQVTVRSTKVRCNAARGVMARYARSFKSPAGWTCRDVVNDRGTRAQCSRNGRSSAAVYGIWIRR